MQNDITHRLKRLERQAMTTQQETDKGYCTCPDGERRFYFIVEGMTEAEIDKAYPENKKHCPRCGGLNTAIKAAPDDLKG